MRRIGRMRRKKQKKILIVGSLSLLLFLCVGYAAFSTSLSLKAKGNIKQKIVTTDDIIKDVVTSGDGLYKDTDNYYYKGDNVDNNILLDNELWRIISIKNDGTLKVIKEEPLEMNMAWDDGSGSNSCSGNSNFCKGIYWGNISYYVSDSNKGEWKGEATLNTYLNNTYYNSLSNEFRNNIVSDNFNIGFYDNLYDWYGRVDAFTDFQSKKWNGKVGLIDVVEYVKSSTNEKCNTSWMAINSENVCTGSYLNIDSTENRRFLWTLNVKFLDEAYYSSFYIRSDGYGIGWNWGNNLEYSVRPVVYLKPDVKLTGDGTSNSPYKIIS